MTTATNPLDDLHSWLYSCRRMGPLTVLDLMQEITELRAAGVPLPLLPKDGISLQEALVKLAREGRAEFTGGGWLWRETARERDGRLFV